MTDEQSPARGPGPTLFRRGDFTLKSGTKSFWKINCDALTGEDWAALAEVGARLVGKFSSVWSCGGASERFALALRSHLSENGPPLVVDDVLTTGFTMEYTRHSLGPEVGRCAKGVVAFARGPCPPWIEAIFYFNSVIK